MHRRLERAGQCCGSEHTPARSGGEHAPRLEHEYVREHRDDLLDVMGDEDHRGRAAGASEAAQELQEVLAGDGVKSGARLVEDHELRRGHQGSANEDALAFALGKKSPRTIAERAGLDAAQDCSGGAAVVGADLAPVADLCVTTADDGFESRFAVVGFHHLMHA